MLKRWMIIKEKQDAGAHSAQALASASVPSANELYNARRSGARGVSKWRRTREMAGEGEVVGVVEKVEVRLVVMEGGGEHQLKGMESAVAVV